MIALSVYNSRALFACCVPPKDMFFLFKEEQFETGIHTKLGSDRIGLRIASRTGLRIRSRTGSRTGSRIMSQIMNRIIPLGYFFSFALELHVFTFTAVSRGVV